MSAPAAPVALVSIGDELLAGKHPDLNAPKLAARLLDLDLAVDRVTIANDDEAELTELFARLCERYELVISTGGLGPTLDDVTRHAAAGAAGVGLVRDEVVAAELLAFFRELGREMSASNERQALFPEGAVVIPNAAGTAPGFRVRVNDAWLVCLPGPPRELGVVLEQELFPWLAGRAAERRGAQALEKRVFHLFGLPESEFAERAGAWMDRPQNPLMGVSVAEGILTVTLRARAATREEARARIEERGAAFRERFADELYSESELDPARCLGELLIERDLSIATAESCTGGGIAARLTDVPGISAVFDRGFVTYANEAKTAELGVPVEMLATHGAVSSEVARDMARGARARAGARIGLSVTGVAGPGGGTPEKPVGTVWFGLDVDGAVETHSRRFPDRGRGWIRRLAVHTALILTLRAARRLGD